MRIGSLALAIAVFMSTPWQPISIAIAASEAVPTPASTITGTVACSEDDTNVVGIANAQPRADGRGQRHDRGATDLLQLFCGDRIVGDVRQDVETFFDQNLRGIKRRRNIREESLIVADHFELDQFSDAGLARQTASSHRVLGVIATGGIRQDRVFLRVEIVEQIFFVRIGDVDPAHGDGDDFRAGDFDGALGFREILVFSGADDQPRAIISSRDLLESLP